jgi:hypothetical protein
MNATASHRCNGVRGIIVFLVVGKDMNEEKDTGKEEEWYNDVHKVMCFMEKK